MATSALLVGLGMAAVGLAGRAYLKFGKNAQNHLKKTLDSIPNGSFSKYYKGGFDQKINKREAGLILGISPNASKSKVKEAHKRIMLLNHPDRGGSPYLAAKINEAKDFIDAGSKK
ncbi:mitochondrial import inner membrane translocase subunit TIM14-like [Mizuhopecten yessoensis]|uniref:Mitochondrial import inner membrane translocase subunit TIM14 n=1 Tax=Mizuhopecten yessoensis TaxID=6573 RepID=A0A210R0Q4_MIZYE|nr:mitochondrial import inner membrane translocase subunit TIM14-like [Mizuhopecten yessoensis]OWF54603.1 Mitochondrial import inner membrane translocase subunit TIM14 [Mizuhopecten yessoensis]